MTWIRERRIAARQIAEQLRAEHDPGYIRRAPEGSRRMRRERAARERRERRQRERAR